MIYLCIRRTLDWRDAAAVEAGLRPEMRPKVAVWNATFSVPYHLFRARLKGITELNLARVEQASRAALDEIPPGAVVVPVDDDDWLAPDLAVHLRRAWSPAVAGWLWTSHLLELPRASRPRLRFWWRRHEPPSTCSTNNYAVANRPELAPLALRHVQAGQWFDANGDRIRHVPRTLAMQNRNLASQTALAWRRPTITRDELVESLERYRALYASLRLPLEITWAEPYIALAAELTHDIRVR